MARITRRELVGASAATLGGSLAAQVRGARKEAPAASRGSLTDVEGLKVGHYTLTKRLTGCTTILMEAGAAVGVDFSGSSGGGHQVILLQPVTSIQAIWGIALSGGGAFGLNTVAGLVRYLEEQKVGYYGGRVPLTSGVTIHDFAMGGDVTVRPDAESAYLAAKAASAKPVEEGNVGAGAGATVGTMLLPQGMPGMKAGVGCASVRVGEVVVAAMMVANVAGDIVDWRTGRIVAGARKRGGKGFAGIAETLRKSPPPLVRESSADVSHPVFASAAVGVVATNAPLTKTELNKIASMAGAGVARAIYPSHTQGDGNTLFAISTAKTKSDLSFSVIGALAADVVAEALRRSATSARSVPGWPSAADYGSI